MPIMHLHRVRTDYEESHKNLYFVTIHFFNIYRSIWHCVSAVQMLLSSFELAVSLYKGLRSPRVYKRTKMVREHRLSVWPPDSAYLVHIPALPLARSVTFPVFSFLQYLPLAVRQLTVAMVSIHRLL